MVERERIERVSMRRDQNLRYRFPLDTPPDNAALTAAVLAIQIAGRASRSMTTARPPPPLLSGVAEGDSLFLLGCEVVDKHL